MNSGQENIIDRIEYLEKIALQLEPSAENRAALLNQIVKYSEDFINRIYEIPAFVNSTDKGKGILDYPISEVGSDITQLINLIKHNIDRPGLNPASGGHLGYIPGGGIYFSALGDYLAAIFNRYAGIYFAGPGAVQMEHMLLDWMAEIVGYPQSSGGNLTSGGSIANLIGIVAARDAQNLKAADFSRSVIYLTSQVHHSVDKAIRIAGLKECVIRYVTMDGRFRMDPSDLEKQITTDKNSGLNPFLIIASAGTTDTGSVDPMQDIADLANQNNIWLHVDGAYGAFFVLCEEGKKILNGMERSDSLVMDPHKGLFLPYGSGAVLVRDKQKLFDSFWYQANYMQDALKAQDQLSPADISPELTKHFRGLRLWLPLKLVGVAPFRAALEEKIMLARYFYHEIQKIENIETGHFPDLSVVTYRYLPKRGDANLFNEKLVKAVQEDGRVFISSTMINGNFTLRLAVLSFRTHKKTIDLTIDILKEKIDQLERE
ncbi:MAG: aminotransferase class I/II-fold pyridoxal phosphate-dependent enzyme [Ignavibacteriales bacterium]|nr:aminotransferase class I/II-fold pyridoxal phosphate-dependent enzyme [Ignavibacteriales bacterium]